MCSTWLASAIKPRNFLTRLHRWAHRQDENFTTEAFVGVIEHLLVMAPDAAQQLLSWLTDGVIGAGIEPSKIVVEAQFSTDHGRPDIRISAPDALVLVEVKATAVGPGQIEAYRQVLDESGSARTKLVLLTNFPSTESGPPDIHDVRWHGVAERLERIRLTLAPEPAFLANTFVEFLEGRGLSPRRVEKPTPLDEAVRHPGLAKRVRSLARLAGDPIVEPLVRLLMHIDLAVGGIVPGVRAKLDSGYSSDKADRWIGFNLGPMKFFVELWHRDPTVVVFETFEHPVPDALPAGANGTITHSKQFRRHVWVNQLDLKAVGFFDMAKDEQVEEIRRFVRDCINTVSALGG